MRDCGEQILLLITHQCTHSVQIGQELAHASVPGFIAGRRVSLGPVAVREFWRLVLGIRAEVQDVPLANSHVLQQLPWSVGRAFGFSSAELAGKVMQFAGNVDVGLGLGEQVDQVLTEGIIVIHNSCLIPELRIAAQVLSCGAGNSLIASAGRSPTNA